MQSNISTIVHLLTACGLTEEFATVVATKHASQIAQDPVAFVQDYWYANNREALGELFYFSDIEGMREALLKLSVEPQIVTEVVSAPHNTELFLHRDAIDWASMVISGQRKKTFKGLYH